MVRFRIDGFTQAQWAATVSAFDRLSLLQCWAYGAAKQVVEGWRVERGVLVDGEDVVGAAQVLLRAAPVIGGGLAWVSRGPLVRFDAGSPGAHEAALRAALAALHRYYVAERGMYLRIAPALADGDPACAALEGAGFRLTGTAGWASAVVDPSPDEGALRTALRANWRSHLNKAERSGIDVAHGAGGALLDGFIAEYEEFLAARGIATGLTPGLLRAVCDRLDAEGSLAVYRASRDGAALGSALIVRTGGTAEYLAGTLLDAGRPLGAGQLLVWRALCDARAAGVRAFDLGGMDPARTPKGIYDFKSGLGGVPYRLAPEIEADDNGLRARLVRWRAGRARAEADGVG